MSSFAGRVLSSEQKKTHTTTNSRIENGNNDITNKLSIPNGKFVNNWGIKRCTAHDNDANDVDVENNVNENNADDKLHHHTNGNGINKYAMENGGHRSHYKRSSHFDNNKYPLRVNILRKSSAYFQENGGGVGGAGGGGGGGGGGGCGTRLDFHDTYDSHSQFR